MNEPWNLEWIMKESNRKLKQKTEIQTEKFTLFRNVLLHSLGKDWRFWNSVGIWKIGLTGNLLALHWLLGGIYIDSVHQCTRTYLLLHPNPWYLPLLPVFWLNWKSVPIVVCTPPSPLLATLHLGTVSTCSIETWRWRQKAPISWGKWALLDPAVCLSLSSFWAWHT